MKNTIGNQITMTLFGESHGPAIGIVLDGMPSGIPVSIEKMQKELNKRRAADDISTARREADIPEILSGVINGYSEGTPIAILIRNENVHSQDYEKIADLARPSHADYTAEMKYQGYQDARGGGHFSGRLTAPIVAAGAVFRSMLESRGVSLATHILNLHGIQDDPFVTELLEEQIQLLNDEYFAVLNTETGKKMKQEILQAKQNQDSVGGILETAVIGLEPGIGEPEFDSLESDLAHALFSIPAVKGVEFGSGFQFAEMTGKAANDPFGIKDGKAITLSNHNGGINGGISNGMPLQFRTAVKPTSSISQKQQTINLKTHEEQMIEIPGRHDPAIIHRARAVVDSMTAFVLCDLLAQRHGTLWFSEKQK